MKISLRKALLIFGVAVSVVPICAVIWLVAAMKTQTVESVQREFEGIAVDTARQVVSDVRRICEIINLSRQKTAMNVRNQAMLQLYRLGLPNISEEFFTTVAKDQYDPRSGAPVTLNKLSFGSVALSPALDESGNPDASAASGTIQKILENAKGVETADLEIFLRMNPEGDMLRVASTLVRKDGTPYIGTYIPAVDPDGSQNPVIQSLLEGNTYQGFLNCGEISFVGSYEPLFDANRNVIGAISYGSASDFSAFICDYLQMQGIGKNGYIWVMEPNRGGKTVFRVSKGGVLNTMVSEDDETSIRRAWLERFIEKAKMLDVGDIGVAKHAARPSDLENPQDRISAYSYFSQWNWIIGVTIYKQDYDQMSDAISAKASELLRNMGFAAFAILAAVVIMAWLLSERMSSPFGALLKLTARLKNGDIKTAARHIEALEKLKADKESNLRALLAFTSKITRTFADLIGKLSHSSVTLSENSDKIAAGAAQMESIVTMQTSSILKVSKTSEAITISSEKLNLNARKSALKVEGVSDLAKGGGRNLEALKENSEKLAEAASAISSRLFIMSQKAQSISAIVTAMSAISEKTNLLALNASIEAKKSGDFGTGFESVASQIRKLSDKTAVSTMSIKNMVKKMQSSVESGVADMNNFALRVEQAYKIIGEAEEGLSKIIPQVILLGPKFEMLAKGVGQQAESARLISETMAQLSVSAIKTKDKISEFKIATDSLNETSAALKRQISNFNI